MYLCREAAVFDWATVRLRTGVIAILPAINKSVRQKNDLLMNCKELLFDIASVCREALPLYSSA